MASAMDSDRIQSYSAGWFGFKQKKPSRISHAVKKRISRIATYKKIDNKSTGTMQKQQSSPSKFYPLHTDSQHSLTNCRSFLAMPVDDRWKSIRQNRLCFKCLAANLYTRECKSTGDCKIAIALTKNFCPRSSSLKSITPAYKMPRARTAQNLLLMGQKD